jgi:hypothetical protein
MRIRNTRQPRFSSHAAAFWKGFFAYGLLFVTVGAVIAACVLLTG